MDIKILKKLPTLDEYKFLRSSVGWTLIDENAIVKGIDNSVYSILVKSGNKTIGMGRIVGDGGIFFFIVDIIVIREFQGNGIGKAIVQNLMDWIQSNNVNDSRVFLFSANGREGFYEKFGFETVPNSTYGSGMQWIWKNGNIDKTNAT